MKRSALVSFALVLCLALIPVFPVEASGSIYSVAYIYSTDLSSAESYRSLLISYGITVELVNISDAETWDYTPYSLVIIGSDTGSLGEWTPTGAVTAINNSLKPILGIGEGGYAFFGNLSLTIGYPNGAHAPSNDTYVIDPAHPIFNNPININVPGDQIIQLYTHNVETVTIYLPSPVSGVNTLSQISTMEDYYPLIQEDDRYTLWGFTSNPTDMTQTGKDLFINLVLWRLNWTAPTSYSAAFVYYNLTMAQDYQTLLEANGVSVDLVPNSTADSWDYGPYGVIVIGSETGYRYDWWPKSAVPVIDGTGKPILGLGDGGSSFFAELGLFINWGQGWSGTKDSIYVVDADHQIFHFPNEISIPGSNMIQLYTFTYHIGIYLPSPEPYVTPLGRETDDMDHYPLIQEEAQYILWGFQNSPTHMTQTGKDLFINIIYWLQGEIIPEFPTSLYLIIALLTTTIAIATAKRFKNLYAT